MAMVLDVFVKRYLEKLAEAVEGEVAMLVGAKKELRRLQRRLSRLQTVLQSADRMGDTDREIGTWVRELKDVMYDADDIIDYCTTQGAKKLQQDPSSATASRVCYLPTLLSSCFGCVRYYHRIGIEVRIINERLKEIEEDRATISRLNYHPAVCIHDNITISSGTSYIEVRSDIVGTQIEVDAKKLIDKIVGSDDEQKSTLYAIVGMGGIGKTTLARRIFNDDRICDNFGKRVWLHVSKNYSENQLLKVMIRSLGGNVRGDEVKSELEPLLTTLLPDKLFLVLDDTWNGNVWTDLLRPPIMSTRNCCRILVTTRNAEVARNISASVQHNVAEMDDESCWELLRREVFRSGEQEKIANLKDIGVKIVGKCHGLPLAIKAIAGVLRSKERSRTQWQNVLASDIWSMRDIGHKLPNALYLSYVDLQPPLKQCFLYCCLYPENNRICDCRMIIRLWVAEGFIGAQCDDRLMEDKAQDYYKELVWRNLVQPDPVNKSLFMMHDLYRSLAQVLMSGEGISTSNGQVMNEISTCNGQTVNIVDGQGVNVSFLTRLHRLSMSNIEEITPTLRKILKNHRWLRAFFLYNCPRIDTIDDDLLGTFGRLRVLLLNDTKIDKLPRSIEHLLHLRYLDLDRTNISEIPESIGSLVNLQTFSVADCSFLQNIPRTINMLLNLRCLRVSRTPLTHLPKGISRLKNINHLGGFIIGHEANTSWNNEGCDLEELQYLTNLRHLSIHRLERAVTEASVLDNKHFLAELSLWGKQCIDDCSTEVLTEEEIQRAERIYDKLSPCSSLRELDIEQFPARNLPNWIMSSSLGANFPNLEVLRLQHSSLCVKLPPELSQLPELKYLEIIGMNAITTIEQGFLKCSSTSKLVFPKLEHLKFLIMQNWREWTSSLIECTSAVGLEWLSHLKRLDIIECPKLEALPEDLSYAKNLNELHIEQCHDLSKIKNLPFLTELRVINNQGLQRISNLRTLSKLEIDSCTNLKYVENLDALQHLIVVYDVKQATQLPVWLLHLASHLCTVEHQNLRKLELKCHLELFHSCLEGGIYWNVIQTIAEVRIRTLEGSIYINYKKNPFKYETNAKRDNQNADVA